MKNTRYLVAALGAAVICAFAVLGTGQQTTAPGENGVTAKGAHEAVSSLTVQQTKMRRALDAHPTIIPWLLEQAAIGDEQERPSAFDALDSLTPLAASEVIKALSHQNPAIRQTAMSFLPRASLYPSFPLNEAIALLLKIAQDENEDDAVRKQARMTVYQMIGASQGVSIRQPQG